MVWSDLYTRPADVLLPNWVCSKPAALDFTAVLVIIEAGTTAGSAALLAEGRKHDHVHTLAVS